MELAEEVAAETTFVVSDKVAHLLRNIIAAGVLEKYINLLRIPTAKHAFIGHIQFLTGVAAETAPEQHHTYVALVEHVIILILLALTRH